MTQEKQNKGRKNSRWRKALYVSRRASYLKATKAKQKAENASKSEKKRKQEE